LPAAPTTLKSTKSTKRAFNSETREPKAEEPYEVVNGIEKPKEVQL
jgi:hypothetical protein